jgi:hypothetical protein
MEISFIFECQTDRAVASSCGKNRRNILDSVCVKRYDTILVCRGSTVCSKFIDFANPSGTDDGWQTAMSGGFAWTAAAGFIAGGIAGRVIVGHGSELATKARVDLG